MIAKTTEAHFYTSLAGATLVITRPAGTSASLAARMRAGGGQAVRLPGVSLRAPSDAALARSLLRDRRFDAWIFSSPAAVRFCFRIHPSLRIARRADVFAVGEGTARALARHGIRAVVPHDRFDSEGLLALPDLTKVRGRRIALIGAPGGRDLIAPGLRRRGATIERIDVYRRMPPRLTLRHFAAIASAPDPLIMLISSGEALANLCALLPAPLQDRLRRQMLVVSSARLAEAARAQGFRSITQARSALPRDLIAAAEAVLARHRL